MKKQSVLKNSQSSLSTVSERQAVEHRTQPRNTTGEGRAVCTHRTAWSDVCY